jgi:hypothetical protein
VNENLQGLAQTRGLAGCIGSLAVEVLCRQVNIQAVIRRFPAGVS